MNAKQALAKARALFGDKALVEQGRSVTSDATRSAASEEAKRIKALPDAERLALKSQLREACAASCRYQYKVGHVFMLGGPFGGAFMIAGQGDTWEQALEKAKPTAPEKKKARKKVAA